MKVLGGCKTSSENVALLKGIVSCFCFHRVGCFARFLVSKCPFLNASSGFLQGLPQKQREV